MLENENTRIEGRRPFQKGGIQDDVGAAEDWSPTQLAAFPIVSIHRTDGNLVTHVVIPLQAFLQPQTYKNNYWIGLSFNKEESKWEWIDKGTPGM